MDGSSAKSISDEEYLDRFGVNAHLKEIVTLLLENRPSAPIDFTAEYFRNVAHGSSPLVRSYSYIKLTRQTRSAFMHNLVSAYMALETKSGTR
jgi:hypothetical protein